MLKRKYKLSPKAAELIKKRLTKKLIDTKNCESCVWFNPGEAAINNPQRFNCTLFTLPREKCDAKIESSN